MTLDQAKLDAQRTATMAVYVRDGESRAPLRYPPLVDQGEHMPIFVMKIDKRPVMAFSGNYSTDAEWDAVPFFNMLKGDLRESLFDPGTGKPIWDGITPIKVRLATPAEVQTWNASRIAEGRRDYRPGRLRRLGGVSCARAVILTAPAK